MADQPKIDVERMLADHWWQPWDKRYCQKCRGRDNEVVAFPCDAYQLALALRAAREDMRRLVLTGAAMIVWLSAWKDRMDKNYAERREYDFAGALLADGKGFVEVVDELREAIDLARRNENAGVAQQEEQPPRKG